jgi:hypothetical protein
MATEIESWSWSAFDPLLVAILKVEVPLFILVANAELVPELDCNPPVQHEA